MLQILPGPCINNRHQYSENIMLDALRKLSGISMLLYGAAYLAGLLIQGSLREDFVLLGIPLFALVAGVLTLTHRRHHTMTPWRLRWRNARRGAWTLGFVGLAAGIVGTMALSDSNLGPLLGIVFTGPLGFLLGALIGVAWPVGRDSLPE